MRFVLLPICLLSMITLTESTGLSQSLKGGKSIIEKAVDEVSKKLYAKDQKTVIAGLKESAELKNLGKPLLPRISQLLLGKDQRIIQQSAIAMEQIDAEFHSIVMGFKPPRSWANKTLSLHKIMESSDEDFELFKPILDWQFTMINTLEPSKTATGQYDPSKPLEGENLAASQLIRILKRMNGKEDVMNAVCEKSISCFDPRLRMYAYQFYIDKTKSDELDIKTLRQCLTIYAKGLADPSWEINVLFCKEIGNLGVNAKGQLPQLERIAAAHPSKEVRAAARDAIKKIEK